MSADAGFAPQRSLGRALVRMPFGLITGPTRLANRGLTSAVAGDLFLALGGIRAVLILPSMIMLGRGVGEFFLTGRGFLRRITGAGLVVLVSAVVIGLRRVLLHHRRAPEESDGLGLHEPDA